MLTTGTTCTLRQWASFYRYNCCHVQVELSFLKLIFTQVIH